jgi:DnaK suppressor protein
VVAAMFWGFTVSTGLTLFVIPYIVPVVYGNLTKKATETCANNRYLIVSGVFQRQPIKRFMEKYSMATKNNATEDASKVTIAPRGGPGPYTPAEGEEYMNQKQQEHFRSILLNWKKELMEEVDRTVDHMQSDASNFADPADRATQEEEFSLELRTRDRERKLIKKIDESLDAIDTGEYGYCEACGVEIGIKRLEARPTATLCIDCKTLQEIKEKQISA